MADDGYNTTVTLMCGCSMRLNVQPRMIIPRLDDWYSCPTRQHSEIREYDPRTGDPSYERDQQVRNVQFDGSGCGS